MKKLKSPIKTWFISLVFIFLTGLSSFAFAAPGLAPVKQEFQDYLNNLKNGKVIKTTKQGHHLGLIPSPIDFSHMKGQQIAKRAKLNAASVGGLSSPAFQALGGGSCPSSYDLRPLGKVTSVKNQDPYETCWSFATYGSMESCLLPGQTRDFSEKNLANLAGFELSPSTGGGNFGMSTAYLARWNGPVNESDDPYPTTSWTSSPAGLPAQKHIQEVLFLPDRANPLDNDNIKEMLMDYGAVATCMYMDDDYSDKYISSNNCNYYYNVSSRTATNHCVTIVGWDDNYASSNFTITPPGNGAFIIKNSWGTGFGDNGYFYISYYDSVAFQGNTVFDDAESTGNYYYNYQYDPLGATGVWGGWGADTGWFANIFNANSNEELSAVGFYTSSLNSTYTIYIYSGFNGTSFTGLLESQSGTMAISGYHTIALNSIIPLTAGQKFCVVVKLYTPGYDYPISIEAPQAGYCNPTASPGQSYISGNGSSWFDMTTLLLNTNVCLKAFTSVLSVTSINPNNAANTGPVSITNLAGSGFITGASVKLSKSGQTDINATGVSVVSPNQITCAFNLNGMSPGSWNVTVSTGGPGSMSATLNNGFLVVSSITVSSIAPNNGINTGPVNITNLSGSGFVSGSTVQLAMAGQSAVSASTVTVVSPGQITCAFNLTGLATGYWNVIVSTGGAGSTAATLANGFIVNPMTITSITPNSGLDTGSVSIASISGAGFVPGTTVNLSKAGQAAINAANVSVISSTQITCSFNLVGQSTGTWDVVAATGSVSASLPACFTINPMTVTSITPDSGINTGPVNITNLSGSGFANGSTVQLAMAGQSAVYASSVTVVSPGQITCAFNLTGLATGYWNVIVSTGGPGSISATLAGGFWVVNSMALNSITPNSGINTGPVSITNLSGAGFVNGAAVQLSKAGQSAITASAINVISPSQIACAFNLAGLSTGYWNVVVSTGGAGSTTAALVNGFLVNPMTLNSITPNSGINTGPVNITNLSGNGFVNGSTAQLAMSGQNPVNASNVAVVSSTQITCAFNLAGIATGYWNVIVSTGGPGSLSAALSNGFLAAPAPVPPITAGTGIISGKVTKVDGVTAVAGAILLALQNGTTAARSISDISGNYSMQVAAGTYSITASSTGYVSQIKQNQPVTAGLTTTVNFALAVQPGNITTGGNSLNDAHPYPSFARLSNGDKINFAGITPDADLRIFSPAGYLVQTLKAGANGTVPPWDGSVEGGGKAGSGTYIIRVSDDKGNRKTLKILILK